MIRIEDRFALCTMGVKFLSLYSEEQELSLVADDNEREHHS